jgi:signal transduction histidine kinase
MQAKEMLVTMSHEIRSPLSGVVLATTDLDTEQRQLVDVMVSSGDLVLQLINNILDLSKVQSGEYYISPSSSSTLYPISENSCYLWFLDIN